MFKNVYKFDDMKREQHNAVRNTVGYYLFTHQLMEVTGDDAGVFLEKMFPKPVANLKIGSARYTTMLNEDGIIIDDVVIFRLDENLYWISTLYVTKDMAWFDEYKGELRVSYRNITEAWEMYSAQGPKALDLTNAVLDKPVDTQKFFTISDNTLDGIPVKVARSGFTGEKLGYEIYIAPDKQEILLNRLKEKGSAFGGVLVTELQVMVWTLSTEKGMYLMCDLRGNNPFEVELTRGIDWDKDFVGKEALLKIKAEGPAREVVGFTVAKSSVHIPSRHFGGCGTAVMYNGDPIGFVTKFTYGFTVDKNIGYALVDKNILKKGDIVSLNDFEAVVTDRVFVS